MNLLTALKKTSAEKKSAVTFISSAAEAGETLTYERLYRISLQVLGALQSYGIKAGDELVIQTESNRDFVCLFWGCMLGGIIPVPLSGGTQTEQKLKYFQVWKYLSNPYLACEVTQLERLRSVSGDEETKADCFRQMLNRYVDISELFLYTAEGTEAPVNDTDIAYIQFSSGSTGMPKGVCLTHENLAANVQDISDSLHISDSDKLLNWMPLTHDMGIIGFHLLGVWRGLDAVSMHTNLLIRRPLLWMDLVSAHKATVLYSPNFGLQYFLNSFKPGSAFNWDLCCIRIIVNGAEPISAKLCMQFTGALKKFGLNPNTVVAAYGLAESSVEVSTTIPGDPILTYYLSRQKLNIGDEVEILHEESNDTVSFVEVGKVAGSCSLRICNNSTESLPEKVIGHIQIKGRNVTSGYYNNEKATKEIFTPDHWLKTGDLGFMVNGRLVVTGRLKNIIIVNGKNYYPQDIEKIIIDSCTLEPGKVVACGTGGDARSTEKLIIFVLYKGSGNTFELISDSIKQAVFSHIGIQVESVVAVTKIPKTTSGKIRYFELVEKYLDGTFDINGKIVDPLTEGHVPVQANLSSVQQLLMREVSVLLASKHIDSSADFFDLGMNSLVAMQLAERLSRLTERYMTVNDIFSNPDILSLSKHICSAGMMTHLPVMRSVAAESCFSLSAAQQRLFGEYLLNKNSAAYNIPVVFTIDGDFNLDYFRLSLVKLIGRYEILRTSFRIEDNEMIQEVHEFRDVFSLIRHVDVSTLADSRMEADRITDAEVNQPFLLEAPAQYRVTEIFLGANRRVIIFVIHHILVDGWSLEIIFHELFKVYNHFVSGTALLMEAPSFQFRDYVFWQQELFASGAIKKDGDYWRSELKGLTDPVDISVSSEHTVFSGHSKIRHYSLRFDASTVEEIGLLTKKYRVSSFSLLLSFLNTIVYRYTNQKDITIGFDSAMRFSEEMENLAGYALNTLCLRTAVTPAMQFPELVAVVHQKVMQALGHQFYPFEKMLEDFYSGSNRLGNPLFSILVLFQNFYHKDLPLHIAGCTFSKEQVAVRDGFTDLLLEFDEEESGLFLHVYYNESKYSEPEIIRFTQHLDNLVHKVYADDTQLLSKYDFLTVLEKKLLLSSETDHTNAGMEYLPVHVLFEQQVRISPALTAVRSGSRSLTYNELNKRANAVAHYLIDKGNLKAGDRIGFVVGRTEKIPVAMMAVLKAGGVYVAIDAEYPVSRYRQIAADSGMRYLLVDREIKSRVKDFFEDGFLLDMDDEYFLTADLPDPDYCGSLQDLAYIIYTSGSTGQPKGVMIEHVSLTAYVQQFSKYFEITRADIFLQQASVAFDTLVEEIFPALCNSAAIVIAPYGGRDIQDMLAQIKSCGVTILSTTPLVLNEINSQADERINSLRLIISGGDVLHPFHIDRLFPRMPVYNTYGPSEATVCATYHKVSSLADAGRIGKPLAGRFIYITDENNEILPLGRTGEICIEGGLARGYLNQPDLTAANFVTHPFDKNKKVYRTGDRGRLLENGELVFLGRADDQIKLSGHRIEPGEIEKMISCYAGVEMAIVVPDKKSRHLVACLIVNETYTEYELQLFLNNHLPYYMVPQQFCIFDRMPQTKTGKIDKNQLLAWLDEHPPEQGTTYMPPVTRIERMLVEIWAQILGKELIGITDNFFIIGGNSLKANQLVNDIYNRLSLEIMLIDIFKHTTIQQLGALLGSLEKEQYDFLDLA